MPKPLDLACNKKYAEDFITDKKGKIVGNDGKTMETPTKKRRVKLIRHAVTPVKVQRPGGGAIQTVFPTPSLQGAEEPQGPFPWRVKTSGTRTNTCVRTCENTEAGCSPNADCGTGRLGGRVEGTFNCAVGFSLGSLFYSEMCS